MDLNREELDLLNELIRSSSEVVLKGIRIIIARASTESYMGDAAHLAHRIMDMEDIDAVLVLLEMDGKILIVARSRVAEFNVSELLKSPPTIHCPSVVGIVWRSKSHRISVHQISGLAASFRCDMSIPAHLSRATSHAGE